MSEIIQTPLPLTLVNGSLMNADEVMELFDYIVAAVNNFAQPVGGVNTEWVALEDTVVIVTTGVAGMTLSGDQSTLLPAGRALRLTLLAGTYVYAWVGTSVYDAGANTTAITIYFRTGNIDLGLTLLEYGILQATPRSTPVETVVTATRMTSNQSFTAPTDGVVIFNNTQVGGEVIDTLGEFNTTTGEWTAARTGHYRFDASLAIQAAAAQSMYIQISRNASAISYSLWRIADTNTTTVTISLNMFVNAGEVYTVTMTSLGNFSVNELGGEVSRFMITRLNGA